MTEKTFEQKCADTGEAMQKAGKNMMGCGCLLILSIPGIMIIAGLISAALGK